MTSEATNALLSAPGGGRASSALPGALEKLLRDSSSLHPDDLPGAVDAAAQAMGARAGALYVVDLDQRLLRRLTFGADPDAPHLQVGDTPAGEAFRTLRPVEEGRSDATVLWLPLLDSADRVGVLGVELSGPPEEIGPFEVLALLVAALVVSKSAYGDSIVLARRSAPVDAAAERRWALLPPLNFATSQLTLSGILQPAHHVAGDAFDYGVRGDRLSFVVIDAMGHGDEASRIADVAIASYRSERRSGSSLVEVIQAMDRAVGETFGRDKFVTAHAAFLDLGTGLLRVLNAGHPPPVLFRAEEDPCELECRPCLPVGIGSVPTAEAEHQLEPGDAVVFYTDGVIEARDPAGREFGLERLMSRVAARRSAGEIPAEILRNVIHETLDFQQAPGADDASLLFVEWARPAG